MSGDISPTSSSSAAASIYSVGAATSFFCGAVIARSAATLIFLPMSGTSRSSLSPSSLPFARVSVIFVGMPAIFRPTVSLLSVTLSVRSVPMTPSTSLGRSEASVDSMSSPSSPTNCLTSSMSLGRSSLDACTVVPPRSAYISPPTYLTRILAPSTASVASALTSAESLRSMYASTISISVPSAEILPLMP